VAPQSNTGALAAIVFGIAVRKGTSGRPDFWRRPGLGCGHGPPDAV